MSFDVHFFTVQRSKEYVENQNPFTGEMQRYRPALPLDSQDLQRVRQVLDRWNCQPEEDECYLVEFPDGASAEIYASELEQGCMVATHGITPSMVKFFFDLLEAARWMLLVPMKEPIALTRIPEDLPAISEQYPCAYVCESAEEVAAHLGVGQQEWVKFRDQVVGKGSSKE